MLCQEQELCDHWICGNTTKPSDSSFETLTALLIKMLYFPQFHQRLTPCTSRRQSTGGCTVTRHFGENFWRGAPCAEAPFSGKCIKVGGCSFPSPSREEHRSSWQAPGRRLGGAGLFPEGRGSTQHVCCFPHVTACWHGSPSACTLPLSSTHVWAGQWEILPLSNLETLNLKKSYFQSLAAEFQQVPFGRFIVREEVICVELFWYTLSLR